MLDQPTAATADAHDFLRRALRWLAIVCVALGSLRILSFTVYLFRFRGIGAAWYYSTAFRRVGLLVQYATPAMGTLLIVGGVALLRWKSWSRRILLTWAALAAVISFMSHVSWFIESSIQIHAATQPALQPSVALMGWSMFTGWLEGCALPVLIAGILLQPEVGRMWARLGGGGFDVVPFATPAAETSVT